MQPENYQSNPNPVPQSDTAPTQPQQFSGPTAGPQQLAGAQPQQSAPLDYVSNPFLVGFRTLIETLKTNPVPVLLTPLVFVAGIFIAAIVSGIFSSTKTIAGTILGIVLVAVFYLAIFPVLIGMYYSIASHSHKDEKISTKEALLDGFKKALPMLGLIIMCCILGAIGLVLLIVPGVIFLVRASLASVVIYEEDLGVFAAIGRSFALTKGHFFETLGALIAGGILGSNGLLPLYFGTTQMVGRYRDYKALLDTGAAKPKVHWLNYFIVLIVLAFIALYVGLIALVAGSASKLEKSNQIKTQQNLYNDPYKYNSDSYYNSGGSNLDYKYDY